MLIRQLLQHRIRKDVLSANKKTNHKCFRDSLPFWDRLLYVAKYHKKKLIALVLLATISYVYDMHQSTYPTTKPSTFTHCINIRFYCLHPSC